MQKTFVLVVAAIAAVNAYMGGDARKRLHNDFTIASLEMQEIREKHNMSPLQYSDWKSEHEKSKKKLSSPNVEACAFTQINLFAEQFDCARGFAYGLQYSPMKAGACYIAVDQAINAAETLRNLLTQFYNPTIWADIVRIQNNYVTFFASINSNCNVQKLIKTLTTDPSVLFPSAVSRVGGGFIMEIPDIYLKMKTSCQCYEAAQHAGNLFSLFFDYYI